MNIIKNKEQQNIMKDLNVNYRPHKHIQYCHYHLSNENYIKNIKKEWISFCSMVATFILTPFLVLCSLYLAIRSLFPYSLTITKKELLSKKE